MLLKLANGVLRVRVKDERQPMAHALGYVARALDKRGLFAFDAGDPHSRDQAVAKTLGVTLDLLDNGQQARYRELAVFPEDVVVPLSTVERLWGGSAGLDEFDTEELCQRLHRLSLLLDLDLATRTIRLHDVMRAYLVRELAKVADPKTVHSTLVEAWGDPHHLPDAYAWRWYAYHLKEAGRKDELRKLLLDFNWLQAKLDATDVAALIADYDTATTPQTIALSLEGEGVRRGGRVRGLSDGVPIGIPPWRRVEDVAASSPRHGDAAASLARHGGVKPPLQPPDEPLRLVQDALRLSAACRGAGPQPACLPDGGTSPAASASGGCPEIDRVCDRRCSPALAAAPCGRPHACGRASNPHLDRP